LDLGECKLVRSCDTNQQWLYNIARDPEELENLAAPEVKRTRGMSQQLDDRLRRLKEAVAPQTEEALVNDILYGH
jgi:hypothetical protein